uniref:VPS9 domain-containing protein n=1 Tax=Trichuris muris TaxID=70415 RepID=A0A5S6QIJ1_TRIMR
MECYLWTDEDVSSRLCSSQIDFQLGCVAAIPSTSKNDSAILCLRDRAAYCQAFPTEDDQAHESDQSAPLYRPLAAVRVLSAYCAFGTVGVITDLHKVFMWGCSDRGQCGLLQEFIKEPVELVVCAKDRLDSGGKKAHGEAGVQMLSISRYQTLAVDLSNALWAWGTPLEGEPAVLLPYRVSELFGRYVLSVASGFGHYVALVEKLLGSSSNLNWQFERKSMHSPRRHRGEVHYSDDCFQVDHAEDKLNGHFEKAANEADNSLLGKLRTKFSSGSVASIEDQFEMLEIPNLSNAASRLSFISRDLIRSSASSSEGSSVAESSFGCLSSSNAKAIAANSFSSCEERTPITTEVWIWGSNKFGQLGFSDCDDRSEPKRLSALDEAGIVSVDAGAFHTVALSCSGEAYVWGSNEDGQLKSPDRVCVPEPAVFKVGTCSKVVELAAGSHFTALLVVGPDLLPECYVCGCKKQSLGSDSTVVRVQFPWSVIPISMFFSDDLLVHGCVKVFLDEHSKLPVDCLCKTQYSLMDQSHVLRQMTKILGWISTEESFADNCHKTLLNSFSHRVKVYQANVMKIYMQLREMLRSADPFTCLKAVFRIFMTDAYQRSLKLLHTDYLSLLSLDVFSSLPISGDAEVLIRRLSDVYSVVHEKVARILEEVFSLPFILFSAMNLIIAELDKDDQSFKDVSNSLSNTGKVFRFYRNKACSTQKLRITYKGWAFLECLKDGTQLLFGLFKRGNDHLDFADIVENSRAANFTMILVFGNSIVVASKSTWKCFKFPLVWLISANEGDKRIAKLLLPEAELEVKFLDQLALNDFVNTFNTAVHLFVGSQFSECLSHCVPPLRRTGTFHFSNGRTYSGSWLLGKPHGSGKMTWRDGRTYTGRFRNGEMDGFGELKTVVNDRWTCVKGQWRNGSLNGLASMEDSSGSLYEGYYDHDVPEGHGALRTTKSLFVGEWKKGTKNCYGVLEKARTKYLGMWENDLPNGVGVLVTLDGVCCRGSFVKDVFRKGTLYLPDGMVIKGEFASSECLNGKAEVYFPSGECLTGSLYGRIQDSLQISSGSLKKCSTKDIALDEVTFPSADIKWKDMFRHAYDLIGQSSVEECNTAKAWESLASYCGKFQCSSYVKNSILPRDSSETDSMWKILDYSAPFDEAYFNMVKSYCKLAFLLPYHPLGRLKSGLADVFNLSYSGIGVHRCLLMDAVQEAKSIFLRFYKYVRVLFPSLPKESNMNEFVSEIDHWTPILSWSFETFSSFICGSVLQSIYPNLFTLYVIKNEDSDKVYLSNIRYVSSKSDVVLLDQLGVDRDVWPVVFTDTADLDKPLACITARMKYYSKAIDCFQRLSSEFSPVDKLKIIAETFEHVNKCVSENCSETLACPWTADSLVPVTTYVLVRAQIQRLGAELNFIRDFAPPLNDVGEIQYMFTTLQCCYQFLVQSKNIG